MRSALKVALRPPTRTESTAGFGIPGPCGTVCFNWSTLQPCTLITLALPPAMERATRSSQRVEVMCRSLLLGSPGPVGVPSSPSNIQ